MPGKREEDRLSARELILTLIDSAASASLEASYFVAAGQIFDMDPGSIRVALARLVRDGSLIGLERGRYQLGSRAGTLHALVRNWSRAEESVQAWPGGWLTVLVGHLARTNKTRVRGNERALKLYGFAEARPGLWVRPANLKDSLAEVRAALLALGLDEQSVAAGVEQFDPADCVDPQVLWDIAALERRYRQHAESLAASTRRIARLDDAAAAGETLLLGRRVTRDILLDPLLPEELIDADLRGGMVTAMQRYDRIGKAYWRDFFERHSGSSAQKPAA